MLNVQNVNGFGSPIVGPTFTSCLFPGVLWLWHFLYSVGPHPVSGLNIYTFVVSRAFMAGAASQAGDADSSRAPDLTSGLQGSMNVHCGDLLLVPQLQWISSFVFYIQSACTYMCHHLFNWNIVASGINQPNSITHFNNAFGDTQNLFLCNTRFQTRRFTPYYRLSRLQMSSGTQIINKLYEIWVGTFNVCLCCFL